jgi:two-component system response regulator NreC
VRDSHIKVLLVDDHAVLRAGLCALLDIQDDMQVVGEAGSGDEAIQKTADCQPDVIVMDLGMPGLNAFDAIRSIRNADDEARIIVLSMHKGRDIVTKALEAGADGYIPKSSAHDHLLQAIRKVYGGDRYLDPAAATAVVDGLRKRKLAASLMSNLSAREGEVLIWTAKGYSSGEIGQRLSISPKTVDTYRHRLMRKLDLSHRSELIRLAAEAGLLD